jgi:hypothetical protein
MVQATSPGLDVGPPTSGDLVPRTVIWALRMLALLVALGAVCCVLVVTLQNMLIRTWAEGNAAAREILQTEGLQALKHPAVGQVGAPQFVPVTLTMFVVLAGLYYVLGVFLYYGFEWARLGATALAIFSAVAGVAGIVVAPPALFIGCILVVIAIGVALLVFLWHPETTRFIYTVC